DGVRVLAPSGRAGLLTAHELILLRIASSLDEAPLRPPRKETRAVVGGQHARCQDDAPARVAEYRVEPVDGRSAAALDLKIGLDRLGRAKKEESLTAEVGAEIVPRASPGTVVLAPPVAYLRPVTTDLRPELDNLADRFAGERIAQPQEVAVPTAILEDGQHPPGVCGGCGQHTSL